MVVCTFVQVKAIEINYVATVVDSASSGTRWPITLLVIGITLFVTHIGGDHGHLYAKVMALYGKQACASKVCTI